MRSRHEFASAVRLMRLRKTSEHDQAHRMADGHPVAIGELLVLDGPKDAEWVERENAEDLEVRFRSGPAPFREQIVIEFRALDRIELHGAPSWTIRVWLHVGNDGRHVVQR